MLTLRVTSPEDLARQAAAVARVRVARVNRDRSIAELRAEIIAALNTGAAPRDIAKAADMTRQRVNQIKHEDS